MRINDTFTVKSPSGVSHEVIEIREYKNAPSLDGSVLYEGLRSYKLKNGTNLNKIGERTFQIPGSNEVLTRV